MALRHMQRSFEVHRKLTVDRKMLKKYECLSLLKESLDG